MFTNGARTGKTEFLARVCATCKCRRVEPHQRPGPGVPSFRTAAANRALRAAIVLESCASLFHNVALRVIRQPPTQQASKHRSVLQLLLLVLAPLARGSAVSSSAPTATLRPPPPSPGSHPESAPRATEATPRKVRGHELSKKRPRRAGEAMQRWACVPVTLAATGRARRGARQTRQTAEVPRGGGECCAAASRQPRRGPRACPQPPQRCLSGGRGGVAGSCQTRISPAQRAGPRGAPPRAPRHTHSMHFPSCSRFGYRGELR